MSNDDNNIPKRIPTPYEYYLQTRGSSSRNKDIAPASPPHQPIEVVEVPHSSPILSPEANDHLIPGPVRLIQIARKRKRKQGINMPQPLWTTIDAIFGSSNEWKKVNKVVAMIHSYTPNHLGDAMITLKDPTRMIDASVHRKVLQLEAYKGLLGVGAVMIVGKAKIKRYTTILKKEVAPMWKQKMIKNI